MLRGGWRVYSSGPGIFIGIIITRLFGIRIDYGNVIIDPVIPLSMDGVSASLDFLGHAVTLRYTVTENCFGPKAISINGKDLLFTPEDNQYRLGGAVIPVKRFLAEMVPQGNIIEVLL